MASEIQLKSSQTALLVMDFQQMIVSSLPPGQDSLLTNTARTIQLSQEKGITVIWVVVGFRSGYPEINPHNPIFGAVRSSGRFDLGNEGARIHPDLSPGPNDIIVTKHRVSAFSGSDLEMILRANSIDTLVLSGISSSGVVLSTLRQAADLDYRIFVLRDACADQDQSVHDCLMDKIFTRQASVISTEGYSKILAAL